MKPFKTDIAVVMIFFNRPDCFEKVFNGASDKPCGADIHALT